MTVLRTFREKLAATVRGEAEFLERGEGECLAQLLEDQNMAARALANAIKHRNQNASSRMTAHSAEVGHLIRRKSAGCSD